MADDGKPSRIRWQKHETGSMVMGHTGHVGTLDLGVFAIFDPAVRGGEHVLTTALSGMGNKRAYGTPDEVKAEAERWLTEFASSLGAVFPDITLWGVRFDEPGGRHGDVVQRYSDEADARQAKREVEALNRDRKGTVMTRQAWSGPWKEAE